MAVFKEVTSIPMENLINQTNLEKIESFMNDPQYREALESSANYNTRLCIERRMRLPFIDTQTGVAQNHSQLFLHKRQRIPGLLPGQIYSYPRPRWRKKRRQYLTLNARAFARAADSVLDDTEMHNISSMENPALQDTDSKDSQLLKDDVSKDWYYDEQDIMEMEAFDEPDPDSDLDYEETYKRNKRRKGAGRGRGSDSPSTPGRKKGGRGRKKSAHNFEPTPGDPDKPFACELCGARYKTRPGLTYHYSHSHKEGASDENSHDSNPAPTPTGVAVPMGSSAPPNVGLPATDPPILSGNVGEAQAPILPQGSAGPGQVYQDSYVSFLNQTPAGASPAPPRRGRQPNHPPALGPPQVQIPPLIIPQSAPTAPLPPKLPSMQPAVPPQPTSTVDDLPMPVLQLESQEPPPVVIPTEPPKENKMAAPSPYCDFCLGDSRENKKTGSSEELVSCADCGRSGSN